MFEINVSTTINRPVSEVFAYYIEPQNRVQWSDHVLDARWLTEGQPGVGSVFEITLRQWGRKLRTVRGITVFEAEQRLCYTLETSYLSVSSCQMFDPVAEGTRFTILAIFRFHGLLRIIEPLMKRQQGRHLADEAANLKRSLESGDRSTGALLA
jgi:uncharacterized protein YndB with AHSA1/START domain